MRLSRTFQLSRARIFQLLRTCAAAVAFLSTNLTSSAISLTLEAAPDAQVGSSVEFSLRISGLSDNAAPSLGAFDATVLFSASLLAFDSITFGDPLLGDQLGPIFGSIFGHVAGSDNINTFQISLDAPDDLDALQADSFVLATLTFNTLAAGLASLDLDAVLLSDALGVELTPDEILGATLEISDQPQAVPEVVSSGFLLLAGFGVLVSARWMRKRSW